MATIRFDPTPRKNHLIHDRASLSLLGGGRGGRASLPLLGGGRGGRASLPLLGGGRLGGSSLPLLGGGRLGSPSLPLLGGGRGGRGGCGGRLGCPSLPLLGGGRGGRLGCSSLPLLGGGRGGYGGRLCCTSMFFVRSNGNLRGDSGRFRCANVRGVRRVRSSGPQVVRAGSLALVVILFRPVLWRLPLPFIFRLPLFPGLESREHVTVGIVRLDGPVGGPIDESGARQ
jgi:hypothetical protein